MVKNGGFVFFGVNTLQIEVYTSAQLCLSGNASPEFSTENRPMGPSEVTMP